MGEDIKKSAQEFVSLLDQCVELEKQAELKLEQAKRLTRVGKELTGRGKEEQARKKALVEEAVGLSQASVACHEQAKALRKQLDEMSRTMPDRAVELVRNMSINPYGTNIADSSLRGKFFNFMHTNLKTEYVRRELMVSLVAFVYQMLEEYQTDPEDELRGRMNAKETPAKERKEIARALDALYARRRWARQFLDDIFEFDPLVHVRGSQLHRRKPGWLSKTRIVRREEYVDVPRALLDQPNSGAIIILEKDSQGNTVERVVKKQVVEELEQPRDPEAVADPAHPQEAAADRLLARDVPADTFARWRRFEAANYEGVRRAVQKAYAEKPDLEVALQVCSVHDSEKKAREWRLREQDKVPQDILSAKLSDGWVILGPFMENRKRVDFYNKNTETIKVALEQVEADQKLGRELMEKRIEKKKRENIRQAGPDAPGLHKTYTPTGVNAAKSTNKTLDGNKMRALENEVEQEAEQEAGGSGRPRFEDASTIVPEAEESLDALFRTTKRGALRGHAIAENVPADAVAVDVVEYNTSTGMVERSHFYTEAEDSAEAKISRGFGS